MQSPHFDLPFRFGLNGVAVVEQDTYPDVANCVEAIIRTPLGFRNDAPNFGFPSLELMQQPIITSDVVQMVAGQEPRASNVITERPDILDELVDRVLVEVRGITGT